MTDGTVVSSENIQYTETTAADLSSEMSAQLEELSKRIC